MNYLNDLPFIFWINMDRSIERRKNMEYIFDKCKLQHMRISGCDASKEKLEDLCDFGDKKYKYLQGQLGCTLSHINTILRFYKRSYLKHCIIMEDDVSFEFLSKWNKSVTDIIKDAPKNWDIIQLSYTIDKISRLNKKTNYIPWKIDHYGTVAYLINRKGAKKILTSLLNNNKFYFGGDHKYIVADYILYTLTKTYTYKLPYFSYNLNKSSIKEKNETLHRTAKDIQKRVWQLWRHTIT
jgi:GR25 family glycosyltransferase involved in LPS biosynthesis